MIKHITSRLIYFVCCIFLLFNSFFALGQKPKNPPKEWIHRIEPRSVDQIFVVEEKETVKRDTIIPPIDSSKAYVQRNTSTPSYKYCFYYNSLNYLPSDTKLRFRLVDDKGKTIKNCMMRVSYYPSIGYIIPHDSNGVFTICLPKGYKNLEIVYFQFEKNVPTSHKFIDGQKITLPEDQGTITYIPIRTYLSYDSGEVLLRLPWFGIPNYEKIVKSKFEFRDVKQLGTRYTDIYLRY